MEPPAKRLKGAKGVPASWYEPSVPWPVTEGKKPAVPPLEGVRYHIDEDGERTYWLFRGRIRYAVCVCQDDGLCGLMATSKTRPGFAKGCALREDRKAACNAARGEDGALPAWEGKKAHKGHEHFVLHRGRECVTRPSSGEALPLCKCGVCFVACMTFQHAYALGCVHNDGARCATTGCPKVAHTQGYCSRCSKLVDATAKRKAERAPELQALMAELGIARAPDDPNDPSVEARTPYAQQNPQADYAPRIVVKIRNGKGFRWMTGCRHGIVLANCATCNTTEQLQQSKRNCSICTKWLVGNTYKLGTGLCVECGKKTGAHQRTEIRLRDSLFGAVGHPASAVDDTYFGTDKKDCKVDRRTKPDALWLGTTHAVICETDEDSHMNSGYWPECDARWATDMATSIEGAMRKAGLDGGQARVFIVRWNPDARDEDRPVLRDHDRARIVGARVKALLEMPAAELAKFPPAVPILIYYYYHSKAQDRIDYARGCDGIVVHDVID